MVEKILTIGNLFQALTIITSLITGWLLSRRGLERWGYLAGFCSLPLWCIMEFWYGQWVCLLINGLYFYVWGRGLANHWRQNENKTMG